MIRTALSKELLAFCGGLLMIVATASIITSASPPIRASFLAPPQIQHLTFGNREQAADVYWLRAIQDFDFCEKTTLQKICPEQKISWLYRVLDLTTDLAPSFRMPYATGALALTVIVNDFAGASLLFDKAVRVFPSDWPILSRAAYHAMTEEKNGIKAAHLLQKAADSGGPNWYKALAARLLIEGQHPELAEQLIREIEQEDPNSPLAAAMRKKWAGKLTVDSPESPNHIDR